MSQPTPEFPVNPVMGASPEGMLGPYLGGASSPESDEAILAGAFQEPAVDLPIALQMPSINSLDLDTSHSISKIEALKNWAIRRKTRLIIGAAALSTAVTLASNPLSELKESAVDAAPWVGAGIVASEAAFCVGGVMMLASIGSKIGNPLNIKKRIPEIAQKANDSKMFKAGFWINAVGAVGDFAVLSAGVLKNMPVESYPILGLTLLDLGATIALRKVIMTGIKNNSAAEFSNGVEA